MVKKVKIRPTDINPSYSYHKGDSSKNDRINFKHWNDLIYKKKEIEKDTTYSSIWLYRESYEEIPEFVDPFGSTSKVQAKKDGKEYYSIFNPLIAENIINFWSDENDIILDPFAGRTRGIVCGLKHRKYYGFEISPSVANKVNEMISSGNKYFDEGYKPIVYCDNSLNVDKYQDIPVVDLIFTCPPYWNIEKYESIDGQLSDINDYNKFLESFKDIMKKANDKLKDNGYICLIVGDFRKGDKLIPFDSDVTNIMEKDLGLSLWDKIVLQNINFGWAAIKFGAIKHKRITSKTHEYILVFKKIVKAA